MGIEQAARVLSDLVRVEVELENILGIHKAYNYPAEKTILPGDVRKQAEQDAQSLRKLARDRRRGQFKICFALLELQLGVRSMLEKLDAKVSGLFAYDEAVGACILINAGHRQDRRILTALMSLATSSQRDAAGDLSRREARKLS